jgi:hypothetical protein
LHSVHLVFFFIFRIVQNKCSWMKRTNRRELIDRNVKEKCQRGTSQIRQ